MPLIAPVADIGHVIQLAIAPVFLLTSVGTIIGVLANRLGRSVDRRRVLTAAIPRLDAAEAEIARREVELQERRIRLIYRAITMAVLSALLVTALIALAFVDAFIAADLGKVIAVLFILAMLALVASLTLFLREIFLAIDKGPRAAV